MIITRTPYRLSFFGGGTDYNAWYESNTGLVIAAGIAHYCYLTVRSLPPFFSDYKTRVVYGLTETVNKNGDIKHPSVSGCLKFLNITDGIEIHYVGDLPSKSGIGSSSSFTVGLLNALYGYKQTMVNSAKLASDAIHVEQNIIGESVGVQDQIMASYGGLRLLELGPGHNYSVKNLILPEIYLKNLEDNILLGFSGISRIAEEKAKKKIDNIINGISTDALKNIQSITNEALNAFQKNHDFDYIGRLLDNSWNEKRKLANGVSASWMDDLYKTAIKNGAYGGKLMGAGGGGFFFFIAPKKVHNKIKKSLSKIKVWVPFKFDHSGSQIIFYNN